MSLETGSDMHVESFDPSLRVILMWLQVSDAKSKKNYILENPGHQETRLLRRTFYSLLNSRI